MAPQRRFHGRDLRTGRRSQRGRIFLITAVTRQRQPVFHQWDSGCACARTLHAAPLDASIIPWGWVIMPDHIHWLLALDGDDLDVVVRRFKSRAARAVNAVTGCSGPLWQAGYHDHAVRAEEDLRRLARYVVTNPVRAGLCARVGDYPFWDVAWL